MAIIGLTLLKLAVTDYRDEYALPGPCVAGIVCASVAIGAYDGRVYTCALRRIAAIGRTGITVVAIDRGMIEQTFPGKLVNILGAGVTVITACREALSGQIAVGKVGRQGFIAHRDGVEVVRIAGRDMAYLDLHPRLSRRYSRRNGKEQESASEDHHDT